MQKKSKNKSSRLKKVKDTFTMHRGIISIIVIGIMGLLFVLWVIYLYPLVENNLMIWELFLIFYVLVIAFWLTMFIGIFGLGIKAFKSGIILSIISAIFDLYYPPFAVNIDGTISLSNASGYKGSIDFSFGYYLNRLGLHGILVFIFTYFIIPVLALLLMLVIIKPKKFKESLGIVS